MDLCVIIKGVSFLLQTGLGTLANSLVLLAYGHILLSEARLQHVDAILCHLALVDMLLLLSRGVLQTMTIFGMKNLLDDNGCKVVIYMYRVSRAMSICITCMLSVFQAVSVAPAAGPLLSRLKAWLPQLLVPSFAALWLLNMAFGVASPLFSIAPRNGTIPPFTLNLGFCLVDFRDNLSYVINGVSGLVRDFAFVGVMLGSSGYILVLLHLHSRKVRGIRRSQGTSMETRAAKTVVMMVVLYTVFFGIDMVMWIYMLTVAQVPPEVADLRVFFSSCYASLSPFFIISSNKKVKARLVCTTSDQAEDNKSSNVKS